MTDSRLHSVRTELINRTRLEGDFEFVGGNKGTVFYEASNAFGDPMFYMDLMQATEATIPHWDFDACAGIAVGGAVLARTYASFGHKEYRIFRPLRGHGTDQQIECGPVDGLKVIVIDDVVNRGTSAGEAVSKLREAGAVVEDVYCLILRGDAVKLPTDVNLYHFVDVT